MHMRSSVLAYFSLNQNLSLKVSKNRGKVIFFTEFKICLNQFGPTLQISQKKNRIRKEKKGKMEEKK
jgi:hypothetical protein